MTNPLKIEILMFTGPDCSACKTMKPFVEEMEHARIIDVTEDHESTARYGIRGGLPVFVKLVDGDYQDRISGAQAHNRFKRWATSI